ncbi:MAG: hypothetical protein ABI355_05580 [Solirubrobacteraceae bacterium]
MSRLVDPEMEAMTRGAAGELGERIGRSVPHGRAWNEVSPGAVEHPELELLCEATRGVVCFRRPNGVEDQARLEQLNAELVTRLEETDRPLVSSTGCMAATRFASTS